MLNRKFTRRVRLLEGRQELITFMYAIGADDQLIEHVTMEVPNSFLSASGDDGSRRRDDAGEVMTRTSDPRAP